jgi:hypothetical protein
VGNVHYLDYRGQGKQEALALARALSQLPSPEPLPDALPAPPEIPVSYLDRFKNRIGSQASLVRGDQLELVSELKQHLRQGGDPEGVRVLLEQMKKRPDLYANVEKEIDTILAGMQEPSSRPNFELPQQADEPVGGTPPMTTPPQQLRPNDTSDAKTRGGLRGIPTWIVILVVLGLIGVCSCIVLGSLSSGFYY